MFKKILLYVKYISLQKKYVNKIKQLHVITCIIYFINTKQEEYIAYKEKCFEKKKNRSLITEKDFLYDIKQFPLIYVITL